MMGSGRRSFWLSISRDPLHHSSFARAFALYRNPPAAMLLPRSGFLLCSHVNLYKLSQG